jgi:ceramide glucosyltransferase
MTVISLIFLPAVILSLCCLFLATYCTRNFFKTKRKPRERPEPEWPPVSIIKPVAGAADTALENALSFCDQDYPSYEVVFCSSRAGAHPSPLLKALQGRFPNRDIRWVTVDENKGPNYKVGNLVGAVREARNAILVISDSDMRVDSTYLRQVLTDFMQENVGLVTCLYRGVRIPNLFTALQALFIQTDFVPNVLLGHRLEGISYSFGATICTTKEILAGFGGLELLLPYLADDYQIGNRVHKKGYAVRLSPYLVDDVSRIASFREYFLHHLRWAITQRVCRPFGYFASGITYSVALAFLFLIGDWFSPPALTLFLCVCTARILTAAYLNRTAIQNDAITRYLWLIPGKDLLNFAIWVLSLFVNTVYWQGRTFRVRRGGQMVERQTRPH